MKHKQLSPLELNSFSHFIAKTLKRDWHKIRCSSLNNYDPVYSPNARVRIMLAGYSRMDTSETEVFLDVGPSALIAQSVWDEPHMEMFGIPYDAALIQWIAENSQTKESRMIVFDKINSNRILQVIRTYLKMELL